MPKAIVMNIQGLSTRKRKDKLKHLSEISQSENVVIVALVESHLKQDRLSGEINIPGFNVHRVDRQGSVKKGGVVLYLRADLDGFFGDEHGFSTFNTEFLCIYSPKLNVVLTLLYRPLGYEGFAEAIYEIRQFIEKRAPPQPNILLMGDFNFPQINWSTEIITGGGRSGVEMKAAQLLRDFSSDFCLTQLIDKPTRGTNILDLVFTNNEDLVYDWKVFDAGISDHRMIMITLLLPRVNKDRPPRNGNIFTELNFFSQAIDWSGLADELMAVRWGEAPVELNEYYKFFVREVGECCERFVPKRRAPRSNTIPRERKILMRRRTRLQRQRLGASKLRDCSLERKIQSLNERLRQSIDSELIEQELRAIERVKENPKFFFSYARARGTSNAKVGPLSVGGELVCGSEGIANTLQSHYVESYSNPRFKDPQVALAMWTGPDSHTVLSEIDITESSMREAIGRLSEKAAPGPDGIPAILLKRCASALLSPLLTLWRTSMEVGEVPKLLKEGTVTPIFKGGSRGEVKNYRPVVLTSHVSKVFERLIAERLVFHLEAGGLLGENQHGFRRGRSCASQLVQHHYSILRMLESGSAVDVAYLDFSKAFDKVDLGLLLLKLRSIGVVDPLLR